MGKIYPNALPKAIPELMKVRRDFGRERPCNCYGLTGEGMAVILPGKCPIVPNFEPLRQGCRFSQSPVGRLV